MSDGRSVGRWFLVPVVLVASTAAAYAALFLSFFLNRIEIRWAVSAHLNFLPSDLLRVVDLIAVFLIVAIWIVPVAWAIGFAQRAEDRVLISGCGKIRILDDRGKPLQETRYAEPGGLFAGVSQDGSRFALQYSDERGDPSHLLYEEFIIYDSATARPVASVSVGDLPERQSWLAFSPDGQLFAVGNPNKLTLYRLP